MKNSKNELSNEYKKYYTYQLIDPRNNIPFYIGEGCVNKMYKHEKDVLHGKIPNNPIFIGYGIE